MKNLLSSNVKHNFNIGSTVTVTSDRDDYEDKSMEAEMLKYEGKKLTIDEIYVIDKELVHYYCIDENGVSPMMPGEVRLAFIDADLIAYQSLLLTAEITGLPELFDIKDNFLTFVGEWMNGKECRTGENRANGTVTYNEDGLYFYEFKTREDAFKYFFEDDRSVPYAIAEYDEEASEENEEETLSDWEFNNGFKPEWLDANKMKFSTIEEGLKAIHEACDKAEISEGEFADYLILNYDECFNSSIEPVIVIQAIQEFRQWDYEMEDDAIECFGGTEALSENGFYGFIFKRDGKSSQLPDGVRVGIVQEDGSIVLDEGISPCFTKVQYALASGSFTEDSELFENYRIAIGQWDGVTNDDDIFHWFSHEDKIIGSHADFIITSYIKDGDSEDKRVSTTPRFCIVQNTEKEGSSTLEDYDTLEKAMEAYSYIKENGCHKSEENDGEIIPLESGTEISMDIEWWDIDTDCLVLNEGIDVPVITIQ